MTELPALASAEEEAMLARKKIEACISEEKCFVLEAGAGAGKTTALVQTLASLVKGDRFGPRSRRRVACVTYTNVATDEIRRRIDDSPSVHCETWHGFFWPIIRPFQAQIRTFVAESELWTEKVEEAGGIDGQTVSYQLGFRRVDEAEILLHHDDVIAFAVKLLENPKFRTILADQFPIFLIDEYQDMNKGLADALVEHFVEADDSPMLIGFFGDHWQQIYTGTCGAIDSDQIVRIDRRANFRSDTKVVDLLNKIRPDLPQAIESEELGEVSVFHSNNFVGERGKAADKGDLPEELRAAAIAQAREVLISEGWDFSSEDTRTLMLTHKRLAEEQGYGELFAAFKGRPESLTEPRDAHVEFILTKLLPALTAYGEGRYGTMFETLGKSVPRLKSPGQKQHWADSLGTIQETAKTGSTGDVMTLAIEAGLGLVPEKLIDRERLVEKAILADEELDRGQEEFVALRSVPFVQLERFSNFQSQHSLFATKHGVKGAEFPDVLVVFGRGWTVYDFDKMLSTFPNSSQLTEDREIAAFERNRNLFYVSCSRARRRLALLFTQELQSDSLATLESWLGEDRIRGLQF